MKKTLLAAAFAAALLAGCSTPSSQAPTELKDYTSIAEPQVVWSKSVGESVTNFLVPAVAGSSVYVAGDNDVYRLDADTGDEVWHFEVDAPVAAGATLWPLAPKRASWWCWMPPATSSGQRF
jgi:outer membrane protein assembly factor BamB